MDFRPGGFRIRLLLTHLPLPHHKLAFPLVTQAHTGPRKVPIRSGGVRTLDGHHRWRGPSTPPWTCRSAWILKCVLSAHNR